MLQFFNKFRNSYILVPHVLSIWPTL